MGTSATLNFGASVTMSGADGTANITVTGDTEATAGTLTFNESGTVSGPGIINFWDVAVGTDDSSYLAFSASLVASNNSAAEPITVFKANNSRNNNIDDLSAQVVVKSTIPATTKSIYLQLYNHDTSGWETKDTESSVAADTEVTLNSGNVTGSTAYYRLETPGGTCDATGNDCWATWRVYQDGTGDGNQILYVDLFSPTFVPERVLWLLPLALILPRILPGMLRGVGVRKKASRICMS